MQFKKILIMIFISSFIYTQSEYEFLYRGNIYNGDVRSMAIGNTDMITSSSGLVTSINPGKLSYLENSVEMNLSMVSNMERRSITILDNWGEFLADTDYVFNDHNYFFGSFGFNMQLPENFGIGISRKPYKSYNYTYEEEVRGERDCPDGFNCIKDPIIGYQIFQTEGLKYVNSIGFGYSTESLFSESRMMSLGLALNLVESVNFKKSTYVDTLHNTFDLSFLDNFDNVEQISETTKDSAFVEAVFSFEFPLSNEFILHLNLKNSNDNVKNESFKIGAEIIPSSKTLIAVQYQSKKNESNISRKKINLGFEYSPFKRMPLRAGLEFSDYEYGNISVLTLGTGKSFEKIDFDFAFNFYTISYYMPSIFAENYLTFQDCSLGCDKVTENNLFISTSIKWRF